jgi:two-component system sensor histidine kinase DegS
MHDGVAQNLAYLLIQVDRCLNIVEPESKLEQQLEQIGSLLKQNIDEIRRNIFDLRPVDLEGKSLFGVLENFVTEFGRHWNLETTCVINGETGEVSPEVESSLYRILQETLANARQHAHCSQLSVTLAVRDNIWVILEVRDNGQGFDVNRVGQNFHQKGKSGLGLVSMRERVDRIGGQLTIRSEAGQGTYISAMLPLHPALGSPSGEE